MKYPIHFDESFSKNLQEHYSYDIIPIESQSNLAIYKIINLMLKHKSDYLIMAKLDVNIYQRFIKIINNQEINNINEHLDYILPIFPTWYLLEYFTRAVVKN